jgi:hypothetical protein
MSKLKPDDDFDPRRSKLVFWVHFNSFQRRTNRGIYFRFTWALESLFGCPVDLVESNYFDIMNPIYTLCSMRGCGKPAVWRCCRCEAAYCSDDIGNLRPINSNLGPKGETLCFRCRLKDERDSWSV